MAITKDEIIKRYLSLREKLGHKPSQNEFESQANITRYALGKFFGSNAFNKLVQECGDESVNFHKERTDLTEILAKYGNLAREVRRIPFITDWTFHNLKPDQSSIRKVHEIKWSDLGNLFYQFAQGKSEWSDIIHLFTGTESLASSKDTISTIADGFKNEFIPPVVSELIHLSYNESQKLEFEKKVNTLFEMLGFEVKSYGQGTGRNPDGVALSRENGYAILIDAKSRGEGYKIGTEDRKFIEYIRTHSPALKKEGVQKIYFLVVSSKYDSASQVALEKVLTETQVPLSLITAEQLLKILAVKIKSPRHFDLLKFQKMLIKGDLITDDQVRKFSSS